MTRVLLVISVCVTTRHYHHQNQCVSATPTWRRRNYVKPAILTCISMQLYLALTCTVQGLYCFHPLSKGNWPCVASLSGYHGYMLFVSNQRLFLQDMLLYLGSDISCILGKACIVLHTNRYILLMLILYSVIFNCCYTTV